MDAVASVGTALAVPTQATVTYAAQPVSNGSGSPQPASSSTPA
jgi:hypothetical protein